MKKLIKEIKGYEVLESFYVGNGWYCDGGFGKFDYYEAWAHHTYPLLWILLTDLSDAQNQKRAEEKQLLPCPFSLIY